MICKNFLSIIVLITIISLSFNYCFQNIVYTTSAKNFDKKIIITDLEYDFKPISIRAFIFDNNGRPVVVILEDCTLKFKVWKNDRWQLGIDNYNFGYSLYLLKIGFNNQGEPYVLYSDSAEKRIELAIYSNNRWLVETIYQNYNFFFSFLNQPINQNFL